jgi:hypothetical protein
MTVGSGASIGAIGTGSIFATTTQLAGTTTALGGTFAPNECNDTGVGIGGAATGMAVVATPTTAPPPNFFWTAWVAAPDFVAVRLCNSGSFTTSATNSVYNIRVIK